MRERHARAAAGWPAAADPSTASSGPATLASTGVPSTFVVRIGSVIAGHVDVALGGGDHVVTAEVRLGQADRRGQDAGGRIDARADQVLLARS